MTLRRVGLARPALSAMRRGQFAAYCRVLVVGGVVVSDVLVIGLDLATGLEVHAEDRKTLEWRKKGHNGDQTLVCLACYQGPELPDGPRVVALVPKGKEEGARCRHFAHPPGMAPPSGRHNPESLEHARGKQALRAWAIEQGFTARVEARTADGRRRSDVEVILPGGARVAIELQCSEITDAEWLGCHEDYVRAGITDVWLWGPGVWIPRVAFRYGQPGWRFDSESRKIALVYASPDPAAVTAASTAPECVIVHIPPCPGDRLGHLWIPLASARLGADGIEPSAEATAELTQRAADVVRELAARQARAAAARRVRENLVRPLARPPVIESADPRRENCQILSEHEAFRYDAFPPWTDPHTWWYRCDDCGDDRIPGTKLKASPVIHIVATYERTGTGRLEVVHRRYGAAASEPREQAS
jgi:Competence protein CoiA-like family